MGRMSEFIDFKTLERPKSPNTYLIAPPDFVGVAKIDEEAPVLDRQRMAVFDEIVGMAMSRNDWSLIVADEKTARLHIVETSRWLRFRDDLDIVVLPVVGAPDQCTLAAYSRSRKGWGDFGVNRKRVQALLARLKGH